MPEQAGKKGRTILEIGFGRLFKLDAGIDLKRGDLYLAADVSSHIKNHAGGDDLMRKGGIKFTPLKADGLAIPLKDNSVDHIVMHNVVSEPQFPNQSIAGKWKRKKLRTSFRKAIEKLEGEMHRVAKPGATAFLSHEHQAEALHYKDYWPFGKTRMEHLREVFGKRWHWQEKWGDAVFYPRGKKVKATTLVIRLTKK